MPCLSALAWLDREAGKGGSRNSARLSALTTPQARSPVSPEPWMWASFLNPTEGPPPQQSGNRAEGRASPLPAAPSPASDVPAPTRPNSGSPEGGVPGRRAPRPSALTCGDAQLLGAAAEAPHHLAAAEVRQVPHDALRFGLGLRPGPRVPRSRRRSGARIPRTGRGTRAGARLVPESPPRPAGRVGAQRARRRPTTGQVAADDTPQ